MKRIVLVVTAALALVACKKEAPPPPPPAAAAPAPDKPEGQVNIVAWPGETLGLWAMEQSASLDTEAAWTDVPLWMIEYDAASGLRKHVATNSPTGFYRLRKL